MHTSIKVNDFIVFRLPFTTDIGVVLRRNDDGGTLKILSTDGKVRWVVTSECEVLYESR